MFSNLAKHREGKRKSNRVFAIFYESAERVRNFYVRSIFNILANTHALSKYLDDVGESSSSRSGIAIEISSLEQRAGLSNFGKRYLT